jgi:polysaccharide chain length determinant protein (PEP-CTERM system associated)
MLPGKSYTPADILAIVRRRALLIVVPPIITTFAALMVSSKVPDIYQSDMLIAVVSQRVPNEFVRSTVTLRMEERLNTITSQIMSRTVLEPLITELNLYPKERARLPMEDVVQEMRDAIEREFDKSQSPTDRREEPRAFHVRFKYADPLVATRVTERLGSIFVDQNARDRGALAEATDEFLESQLNEARQKLEEQEKRVEAYRKVHGSELPSQLQSNMQAIQSMQLQIQALVEGQARDRDRKLMLERLYQDAAKEPSIGAASRVAVAAPGTPGSPGGPPASAQQQLLSAKALLASLELRLTPEHPDIIRTKRQIAELEPKAATEAASAASDPTGGSSTSPEDQQKRERLRQMKAEIESIDRQSLFKESEEKRMRAQVAEYQRRIEAVPGIESEWTALTRDYETQQTAYKDLLTKSEAAKVAVDLENRRIGENFRVLDPPRVPVKPISPKRIQISGAGLGAGLVIGLALIALLEVSDASFRAEGDVVALTGLPVLGTVPFVETANERRGRIRRWILAASCAVVMVVGGAYVFWTMRLWTFVV